MANAPTGKTVETKVFELAFYQSNHPTTCKNSGNEGAYKPTNKGSSAVLS